MLGPNSQLGTSRDCPCTNSRSIKSLIITSIELPITVLHKYLEFCSPKSRCQSHFVCLNSRSQVCVRTISRCCQLQVGTTTPIIKLELVYFIYLLQQYNLKLNSFYFEEFLNFEWIDKYHRYIILDHIYNILVCFFVCAFLKNYTSGLIYISKFLLSHPGR